MFERLSRFDGAGTPFDWPEAVGFGRQPYASFLCGPWACVAGPQGLAIGAFCWTDPDTGQASNVQADGTILSFVLPLANQYNIWERVYVQYPVDGVPPFPQQIIRPGVACVIAVSGVFSPKFPFGGQVGNQVYADPATGLPYSGNVTGGYIATPYTLAQSGGPNCSLRMSSFIQPFPN
jgi:hypothetical protein